jgi:hypothetical protein
VCVIERELTERWGTNRATSGVSESEMGQDRRAEAGSEKKRQR